MSRKITQGEANIISQSMPAMQINQPVGDKLKEHDDYDMVVIPMEITADASGAIDFIMPNFNIRIVDAIVQCRVSNASGTLQLRRVTTAITDAIICAVDHVIDRGGTIDDAQRDIVAGETLNIIAAGAADRGVMYVTGYRRT